MRANLEWSCAIVAPGIVQWLALHTDSTHNDFGTRSFISDGAMLVSNLLPCFLLVLLRQTAPLPTSAPAAVPKVLEDAFRYHESFRTARFEYRRESQRLAQNERAWHRVENNETRWAIDGAYFKIKGDDDGINYRLAGTMEPALGLRNACLPSERVIDFVSGRVWDHEGSYEMFGHSRLSDWSDYVDIRTVGLHYCEVQRCDPMRLLETIQNEERYRFRVTASDPHRTTVIGIGPIDRNRGEHFECEWEIDVDKGPSVTSVRNWLVNADGRRELWAECQNQLVKNDGRWWPESTEYKTEALRTLVQFSRVEFNRPEHPWDIDPEYLGLTVGTVVQILMPGEPNHKAKRWYVGRGKTVDSQTWQGMKAKADLAPFRAHVARMAALGPGYMPAWWDTTDGQLGLEGIAEHPDEWTTYLRRWKYRHTTNGQWKVIEPLTDEQCAAAEAVLQDCRETAAPIRRRLDVEIRRINDELAALNKSPTTSNPSDDKARYDRISALHQQKMELDKSREIAIIFIELKSRLEDLLTLQQKNSANAKLELGQRPPVRKRRQVRPQTAPPAKSQGGK